MHRLASILVALLAFACIGAPRAGATGGSYVFDGGTATQRATVRAALDRSAFDWSAVDTTVTIAIEAGHASEAEPGRIWLDADILDTGVFSWGVVQHEYAHQVDWFSLDDAARARLANRLGGDAWWAGRVSVPHDRLSSERFASTLAWAYWSSPQNSMRPTHAGDESAALAPAEFRRLLDPMVGRSSSPKRSVTAWRRA